MAKLIDLFNKLKSDYKTRQKKIDDILDNTNKALITHEETMKEIKKLVVTLRLDIVDLHDDYDKFKLKINEFNSNLKCNLWLQLFGIK